MPSLSDWFKSLEKTEEDCQTKTLHPEVERLKVLLRRCRKSVEFHADNVSNTESTDWTEQAAALAELICKIDEQLDDARPDWAKGAEWDDWKYYRGSLWLNYEKNLSRFSIQCTPIASCYLNSGKYSMSCWREDYPRFHKNPNALRIYAEGLSRLEIELEFSE